MPRRGYLAERDIQAYAFLNPLLSRKVLRCSIVTPIENLVSSQDLIAFAL